MLDARMLDRAAGVLLGAACGDALGAAYELGERPLPPPGVEVRMAGSGLASYEPGQWTDDSEMALLLAGAAADADLATERGLDALARALADWFARPPGDFGAQIGTVIGRSGRRPSAARLRSEAARLHDQTGRTAGKAALVRVPAVALAGLDDPVWTARAARETTRLTHADPLASEASVLWTALVRIAVLEGRLDPGLALHELPTAARGRWSTWLTEAERCRPEDLIGNGFVVRTVQAAWSAVSTTPVPDAAPERASFPEQHLRHGLDAAVRAGGNCDTVACVAGALLGARWGATAVPSAWRSELHGWPGLRADDLELLSRRIAERDRRGSGPTAAAAVRGGAAAPDQPTRPRPAGPVVVDDDLTLDLPGDARAPRGTVVLWLDGPPSPSRPAGWSAIPLLGGVVTAATSLLRPGREPFTVRFDVMSHGDDVERMAYVVDDAARLPSVAGRPGLLRAADGAEGWAAAVAARHLVLRSGASPADALSRIQDVLGAPLAPRCSQVVERLGPAG